MEKATILHIFTPEKNVSPFDVNMAIDAGFEHIIPYTSVEVSEIAGLVQDAIFSRGPKGVKRTGIFIGGRDIAVADDMLKQAKQAMVPPFEASVMLDPSGSATTAAGLVALVIKALKSYQKTLQGEQVAIFGGTGPVGLCAGVIAARCGADVRIVSHRGMEAACKLVDAYSERYAIKLLPADGSTPKKRLELLQQTTVAFSTAKAGVQVLTAEDLLTADKLLVAADVNAVPPEGIAGVGVMDNGKALNTPLHAKAIGALAIGNVKYQVQHNLLKNMLATDKPVYLELPSAFELACQFAEKS
ncbi:NAD(P)-dependent methylenetetrahydromethanopterin dehydrogenase [Beggiatoa leptomitoformis]|uniref:Methylenetetrahydromethanopterin dehydrogenase n=1 Tax=Beggiatoa leptomitoformis TaxID=288004 RepID=A0A2N9YCG2_9GAMM|nr:NAD(P)-dependent methylenetetrahydromethanopterin dehydrogenase [Beggiatoa leptomitoformis]ALG66572.1 methylenetetrahydromethanopterin dehydrogenase [Beggiatoa leptomitoformis]AUI68126.1 methylenetetrahydromethanopterin dehydrogenase [Beggiatoa leptomitoformis]